jgi:hypothetical protein
MFLFYKPHMLRQAWQKRRISFADPGGRRLQTNKASAKRQMFLFYKPHMLRQAWQMGFVK